MREQTLGFQFSLLSHALVIGVVWAFGASAVTLSRPLEMDFGIVKEDAPAAVNQKGQIRKEKAKTVAGRKIIEHTTPLASENAAPVAKPAVMPEREPSGATLLDNNRHKAPSGGAVAATGHGRGEAVPFGSVKGPNFLRHVKPEYPFVAKRMNKEGRVILKLTIDERGRLLNVEVVEAAGFGFTEAAVEAVMKSTYRPAVIHGRAILSRAVLPVRFRLTGQNNM
jgi:periplasmic protein TonB